MIVSPQVARFRELFDWEKIKETDGKEGMPKAQRCTAAPASYAIILEIQMLIKMVNQQKMGVYIVIIYHKLLTQSLVGIVIAINSKLLYSIMATHG